MKTFSVGQVRVSIETAGGETRLAGRARLVCIRKVVLLREADVIRRDTGLKVSFTGSV